jgi:hypothetical protein
MANKLKIADIKDDQWYRFSVVWKGWFMKLVLQRCDKLERSRNWMIIESLCAFLGIERKPEVPADKGDEDE